MYYRVVDDDDRDDDNRGRRIPFYTRTRYYIYLLVVPSINTNVYFTLMI